MINHSICCAGIDVSKATLDVVLHPGGEHLAVEYTASGLRKLDAFLRQHKVARAGFEASGGYEWRLLLHLRKGTIAAARFQPVQIKAFAKSRLQRAKNDRLDARLIAAFTASLTELPALPQQKMDGLADRLTYIEQLEERIATLKTMLEACRDSRIQRLHKADIKRLTERRQGELRRLIETLQADPDMARKLQLIVSIPGVGERTAIAILIRLPEIGQLSREQAAALAGLAPFDNDSGTRRGTRHIAGGRQRLRKSLFMAAFSAAQWNPDLKAFYNRLKNRGKHHLAAVIATARKLVILANTLVARDTPWLPKHANL